MEEWIRVMRALWTQEVASYEGEFVHLAPSRMWPKPLQRSGPPVLLGGVASQRTFQRVAGWADGWLTNGGALDGHEIADLRSTWAAAGHEGDPEITVIYNPLRGAPLSFGETVNLAEELGVGRVLYHIFEGDRERMLRRLDRAAAMVG